VGELKKLRFPWHHVGRLSSAQERSQTFRPAPAGIWFQVASIDSPASGEAAARRTAPVPRDTKGSLRRTHRLLDPGTPSGNGRKAPIGGQQGGGVVHAFGPRDLGVWPFPT